MRSKFRRATKRSKKPLLGQEEHDETLFCEETLPTYVDIDKNFSIQINKDLIDQNKINQDNEDNDFLLCEETLEICNQEPMPYVISFPNDSVHEDYIRNLTEEKYKSDSRNSLPSFLRRKMTECMLLFCHEASLRRETLYIAVNYFDRFLENAGTLSEDEVIKAGLTCLFIACKVEEKDETTHTAFYRIEDLKNQIVAYEMKVMKTLKFSLNPPLLIHYWTDFLMKSWDSFIQDIQDEMTSQMEFHVTKNFKSMKFDGKKSQMFKECWGMLDYVIIDSKSQVFDSKLLVIGVIFVVLGRNLGEWSLEELRKKIDDLEECGKLCESEFSKFFTNFVLDNFEFDFERMMLPFLRHFAGVFRWNSLKGQRKTQREEL